MSNLKSRKCMGKYVESPYSSWCYLYLTNSGKHQDTSKSTGRNAFLPRHLTIFTCSVHASVVRNALRWTEDNVKKSSHVLLDKIICCILPSEWHEHK